MLRVLNLLALATVYWVPVGVWIGLRPHVAERLSLSPSSWLHFRLSVIFPVAVVAIIHFFRLDPDIWLARSLFLGTRWFIVFDVIAGASAFPNDLKEAAASFGAKGWLWWRERYFAGHLSVFRDRSTYRFWRILER